MTKYKPDFVFKISGKYSDKKKSKQLLLNFNLLTFVNVIINLKF